jgi:hypothetical protein
MMYFIVNLPFSSTLQNYRAGLVQATMLYTLLTTNYYRSMKSNTSLDIKGRIYAPAIIELVLIISCIALSFIVLTYEIYMVIKNCKNKNKAKIMQNRNEIT